MINNIISFLIILGGKFELPKHFVSIYLIILILVALIYYINENENNNK